MERTALSSVKLVVLLLLCATGGLWVGGQSTYAAEPTGIITMRTGVTPTPVREKTQWLSAPPLLGEERQAEQEAMLRKTHLSPSQVGPTAPVIAGPAPGTATRAERYRTMAPLAPDTSSIYRAVNFAPTIPASLRSTTMEPSVAASGKYVYYTGNWFAARSSNGGATWQFVDALAGFPDFCCDQVTVYDAARERVYWLRMGTRNTAGENVFKLGISNDGGASFCTYTISPKDADPTWTNQWWDYPHIQLGANYLYLAWNMFDKDENFMRSVVLKMPVDQMGSCGAFTFPFFETNWFTLTPVQGASHTMYWASTMTIPNRQNTHILIFRHHESASTVEYFQKAVPAWTYTARSFPDTQALCGATIGNWTGFLDQRTMTGARYLIFNKNLKKPGRSVLTWWWNVRQGGGFPKPYINAASFYEDTLTLVEGAQGRPFIWHADYCYAYPSAAANQRGDLGLILNYAFGEPYNPSVAYIISDEYTTAAPPWTAANVVTGLARPFKNRYGDYNTVRPYNPSGYAWSGGAHVLATSTNAQPLYFVFGRERDRPSWQRWVPY